MITSSLKILLWGKEIGRLSWDHKKGASYFEYNREYLNGETDAFPLIASTKQPASHRPIWGDKETKLYRKLPPFLADSLPDAWGSQVFECWRIENNIRNQEITPLDILSFIGKRGMGALEFEPETLGAKQSEVLHLEALTELARRIFMERENTVISANDSFTMQSLIAVGTSAGGRQPKAIIAINQETGEIRSGQIAGLKGYDYCILKFGDKERSSAELEMAYYEMALAAGIDMMPCRLMDIGGEKHFVTKRFDRSNGNKIHMQTLAALHPEADSYEKLMQVCRKMRLPESTHEEVFRRMVFNILANNTDDHNKNFSFLMDEQGHWKLSPAYDMTYIFNAGGFLPETHHCLLMHGKYSSFSKADAEVLAKGNGIRRAEDIIRQVGKSISLFRTYAKKYDVKERWISAIENTLTANLKSWGLMPEPAATTSFEIDGKPYTNIHIERAYKGNFHLYATINGKERKFVISKNKPAYSLIEQIGANRLSEEQLKDIVKAHISKT